MTGLTCLTCATVVNDARVKGKTETSLGVICLKEDDAVLTKYLAIFDQLGVTTTYKDLLTDKGKFCGYHFLIKL